MTPPTTAALDAIEQPHNRFQSAILTGGIVVLAVVVTSQMYVWVNLWPVHIGWGRAIVWSLPQLLLWGLLIPVVRWAGERFALDGRRSVLRLVGHAAGSMIFSLGALLLLDASDRVLHWSAVMGAPDSLISRFKYTRIHLHIGIALYWVVLALNHVTRYYGRVADTELRAARLETELAESQLQALRMQLNPHFLFNTLNSIGVLMRHDVARADQMLAQLGNLLRSTLEHAAAQEVTLAEELEYLRAYVAIEEVRFGARLSVRFEVDSTAMGCAVPFLALQPLVENAIRHGIAPRAAGGSIEITARRTAGPEGEVLDLAVRDDGVGRARLADAARRLGHGVGLSTTKKRLERLYGGGHHFEVRDRDPTGVEVRMRIPFLPLAAPAAKEEPTDDPRADR